MDKKLSGAAAAFVGALLYGGSQLVEMEQRIAALEDAQKPVEQLEAQDETNVADEQDADSQEPSEALEE